MVEWGRLLSGFRGEILGRRFESCPPRHMKNTYSIVSACFFFTAKRAKSTKPKKIKNALRAERVSFSEGKMNYALCLVNSAYCGLRRMCAATYEHIGITRKDFPRAYASATSVILPAMP